MTRQDAPQTPHRKLARLTAVTLLGAVSCMSCGAVLAEDFQHPGSDARPMMRWWWFGPAVADEELKNELDAMHSAGIGGVEIQPVYPELAEDPAHGIRNLRYLSPPFLDAVSSANTYARSLGMRVDITLGSGWPYGGPDTTLANAAGKLKVVEVAVPANSSSVPTPALAEGESLIAAFTAEGQPGNWNSASARRIESAGGGTVPVIASGRPQVACFFIASHTRQAVKRAALGAEGLVLDHFSRAAIDQHLTAVATPLVAAFGSDPPATVFSDSLEVFASDWTPALPQEFQRRRGYDLLPHLPELIRGDTPQAEAVRHDWGVTLSELVRENYLAPLNQFALDHHTSFRSQTYGEPAVTLADEAAAGFPEGEGPQWRAFSFTRWASSASHAYARPVTSAETWTWLHSPPFRATPLDMKVEADRMFLEGVNQIVGHGWPYSPASLGEPGQSLYAAAVFNAHNPWWPVMPDVMAYLQRGSWLLRQGEPANDIAVLLPEDDAQAAFSPGHVSVTDEMKHRISPELMSAVLDSGYNLDYIDASTIERTGIRQKVLLLPPTDRIPLAAYRRIEAFVHAGGKLLAVEKLPSLAPGLRDTADTPAIASLSKSLFGRSPSHGAGTLVRSYAELPSALHALLPPDLQLAAPSPELGFLHRHLPDADIYFLVNSTNAAKSVDLTLRSKRRVLEQWDLQTGAKAALHTSGRTHLDLPPYASTVLVLADHPSADLTQQQTFAGPIRPLTDLSHDWTVSFEADSRHAEPLPSLVSWTQLDAHRTFSGTAIYRRSVSLPALPHGRVLLDLGEGTPTSDSRPANAPGIHALLDPPVREAAEVFVNGQRVGALWHPPYQLDVTAYLKPGENLLEIRVMNTAINRLSAQTSEQAALPPRGYDAANALYGVRAVPQDLVHLEPVPSGLLGKVQLVQTGESK